MINPSGNPLIMLAARDDADVLVLDRVNDAILLINPPAPEA
jgi:hypothetical protein